MEEKITIGKLVNSWNVIQPISRGVLFLGPVYTGKTTFAELISKYVFRNPTNIQYDNGKYNLEGLLSNKSIKMQTVFPTVYTPSKDKQALKLLDIPSMVFPPQSKKWTLLQQKLTVQYTINKTKRAIFLLFVDEKNTRSNATNWKKSIISFVELFKVQSFTDQLINSIAFVFTKIPLEITENIMLNRIKQLHSNMKQNNTVILDKIFNSIILNKRILLFKKVTGDKNQQQEIIQNWSKLQKFDAYLCKKQDIKEISWAKEGETILFQFLKNTQQALNYLASATKALLQLQLYNQKQIFACKKGRPLANIKDMAISEQVIRKLRGQDKKGPTYLVLIEQYTKLANQYADINSYNIVSLVQQIIHFHFYTEQQDLKIFQNIFEGLQLISITNFQPSPLLDSINGFKQLFSLETKQRVLLKLIKAQSSNKRKDFYQFAINTITQSFSILPKSLVDFFDNCKNKLISFANPRQALKMFGSELEKQKDAQKRFSLADSIASILRNKGLVSEAGRVYRLSSNIWEAISCLKETAATSEQCAKEYINYLVQVRLYEQARSACYQFSPTFGYASRTRFEQSLAKIEQSMKKSMAQRKRIPVLQAMSNAGVQQINKIVKESVLKL